MSDIDWTVCVGPGWRALVERAVAAIEAAGYQVEHVKEKFGTLRIYHTGWDVPEADEAERESAHVCEACGQPGKLRTQGGWLLTRCEACFAEGR
jgi:hypothetical protein